MGVRCDFTLPERSNGLPNVKKKSPKPLPHRRISLLAFITTPYFRHTQSAINKDRSASSIQIMANDSTTSVADFLKVLAANLEAHMKGRSMTEEALARASGVSRRTVGNFLRPRKTPDDDESSGSVPSGTLANLFRLATALGVEPWELLCEPDLAQFHQAVKAHIQRLRTNGRTGQ